MPDFQTIVYEKKGSIATVTLNRPERRNALNTELCTEMASALIEAEADPEVRAVVLTGAPPVFCAGQDLKFTYKQDPKDFEVYIAANFRAQETIRHLKKAVIGRINGDALGGGTMMACCCDIVVAVNTARFAMREINTGLTSAGTHFYTIGMRRALEMAITGRYVFAPEAEQWGLINKSVPADKLDETVAWYANMIAELPPMGIMYTKLVNAFMLENVANMSAAHPVNQVIASILHKTEDRAEAQRATLEKRKPVFKGR